MGVEMIIDTAENIGQIIRQKIIAYNEDEYDVDVQWRPKDGLLKGFWPRVRYARVEHEAAPRLSTMSA
jgi:hypothetical protein